jgi:hypothetical protein
MATATFKDLCLDAVDPDRLGPWWAAALGLDWQAGGSGAGRVVGATPAHTIWICRVPEPKAVKQRVHLDIYARSLADLEAVGSTVVEAQRPDWGWTVMADPEGGEYCAFLHDAGYATVQNVPGMPILTMDFVPVPEPKTTKNRIHWDVVAPDLDALVDAGARILRRPDEDINWHVMADPDGNEFCAFAPVS